jgi:hypothetical protein
MHTLEVITEDHLKGNTLSRSRRLSSSPGRDEHGNIVAMGGSSPERRHHYTETTEAYLSKFRKDLN